VRVGKISGEGWHSICIRVMKHAHFFLELDYMLTVRSFGMFQGHLPPLLFLRRALDV
jgi:hypothetical protein